MIGGPIFPRKELLGCAELLLRDPTARSAFPFDFTHQPLEMYAVRVVAQRRPFLTVSALASSFDGFRSSARTTSERTTGDCKPIDIS